MLDPPQTQVFLRGTLLLYACFVRRYVENRVFIDQYQVVLIGADSYRAVIYRHNLVPLFLTTKPCPISYRAGILRALRCLCIVLQLLMI